MFSGLTQPWRERRMRRRYYRLTQQINALEERCRALPDEGIAERVAELRLRRRRGASLLNIRAELFALTREACRRAIDIRQYDVQIAAGLALSEEHVIQMNTGEGKTFVAPFAAALYALEGRGVHVLTANDYLVERDAKLLGPAYEMMGFRVGHVLCDTDLPERRKAYRADITYATVTELGHDFLREYLALAPQNLRQTDMWQYVRSEIDGRDREQRCLRGRHFAIIDETDSVLVDYARQPISISQVAEHQRDPEVYRACREFALQEMQEKTDYTLDLARRTLELTEKGEAKVSQAMRTYGYVAMLESDWKERLTEALMAEHLHRRGTDYVVQQGQVVLVDAISGRLMLGRRMGNELHQALEAKERVEVRPRQQRVKTVTVQSLMRSYEFLAGMTATAWEARQEFAHVYAMKTIRFTPRLTARREDLPDRFYPDSESRLEAVCDTVAEWHDREQPVLVGTWSVEESRTLSQKLSDRGIEHDVLNAVDHKNEAEVIAHAGERGKVTVATNMAGRGVEIPLGEGVEELGGMAVVGTQRHHLRRVDHQLAGRVGRRGKPGQSRFYLALDDDLFKVLPERRLAKARKEVARGGEEGASSERLQRLAGVCQEKFRRHYAFMRRQLLVKDMAIDKTEQILFGQDRL